jgi:hypothetical protein
VMLSKMRRLCRETGCTERRTKCRSCAEGEVELCERSAAARSGHIVDSTSRIAVVGMRGLIHKAAKTSTNQLRQHENEIGMDESKRSQRTEYDVDSTETNCTLRHVSTSRRVHLRVDDERTERNARSTHSNVCQATFQSVEQYAHRAVAYSICTECR